MTAAEPPTAAPAGGVAGADRARDGLREHKKQRTRQALIDAALELFAAQGYEDTTIDEIVAAVEVSQRTFFRYFATKEDVVIGVFAAYDRAMLEELRERPADETPFTAMAEALRVALRSIADSGPAESARFRRLRQVIETTPALVAAHLAHHTAIERALAAEIARRQGVDPEADLRPRLLVAVFIGMVRVAFKHCAEHEAWDATTMAAQIDSIVDAARRTVRDWV
ncbi:TetR family transcriptional regulator [Actinomadura kijaniata]|uniref:TetR family transcriptional regulator n=1 Tax=Actinomadura kijaniata TaxID=46161 RepID=UPI0008355750|nr:TetR family transcriptional regulator [Actinomadura kijaniata]